MKRSSKYHAPEKSAQDPKAIPDASGARRRRDAKRHRGKGATKQGAGSAEQTGHGSPGRGTKAIRFEHKVTRQDAGTYVDEFVSRLLGGPPRVSVRRLIGAGRVLLNGKPCIARDRLRAGDVLAGDFPAAELSHIRARDLQVVHLDSDIVVVNKQPGQLMVPGRNPNEECLRDVLRELLGPREGSADAPPPDPEGAGEGGGAAPPFVVHRLDRDTSGLCVWARTVAAHRALSRLFQQRQVRKVYQAIVVGEPTLDRGEIDLSLRPHPKDPLRMQLSKGGQEAQSEYRTLERFRGYALLEVIPHTGRTHQVRLHLEGIGHPLVVDPMYGSPRPWFLSDLKSEYRRKSGVPEAPILRRTPLHAAELGFRHPTSNEEVVFRADLPEDMRVVVQALRRYRPAAPEPPPADAAEVPDVPEADRLDVPPPPG